MYVLLEGGWFKHPFLKNNFLIDSETTLNKLRQSGIDEIQVDPSLSQASIEVQSITHPHVEMPLPEKWTPAKDITAALKEAVNDKTMPPAKKAKAVYDNSINLMNNLFTNPSAEVIGLSKEAIGDVVGLILSDEDTTSSLMKLVSHDFYTYTHSVNVGILCVFLAKRLFGKSSDHNMHELGAGFFLHDLGKVRVDSNIINKPARLNDAEMKQIRTHPYQGNKLLEKANQLSNECNVIIMQHHEREDGTGYPHGLRGNEIHEYARICCIADVYDALTMERSYKTAMTPFQALTVMKGQLLGHFHKEIFENFVMLFSAEGKN